MAERQLGRARADGSRRARAGECVSALVFLACSGCGRGGYVAETTRAPFDDPTAAPRALVSAPPALSAPTQATVTGLPALSASASAAPSLSASAAAASVTSAPPPLPVLEVSQSALYKTFSVSAAGEITMERDFGTEPLAVGHGKVPPERLSALHKLLREVGFCALAPSTRESSPGYIVIEARFPDVTCSVELPDKRWETNPKAKKVIEAVRALESEGCPKGCKP